MRPATQRGGVLFAITDAHQKVVELGLALTPVRGGLQSILLYYTDTEQASHSHKAAAFSVPAMTDQWTRFTVSVTKSKPLSWYTCQGYILSHKQSNLQCIKIWVPTQPFADHVCILNPKILCNTVQWEDFTRFQCSVVVQVMLSLPLTCYKIFYVYICLFIWFM